MGKKSGFTLVELIGVIVIISILLILLVPSITRVSSKSKISLRDSKINIIKTAASNYGNDLINDYQGCMGLSSGDLEAKCTVSLEELIRKGYMESDTDKTSNLIDPITNKELTGKVLLCFDPINVSINAEYVDDNHYSCPSVDLGTGNTLTIVPTRGTGYVGGKSVEASIISGGAFEGGFSCTSSDTSYATCQMENNKLKINISKNKDLSFGSDGFEEITITVQGKYKDDTGADKTMSKDYALKVYPTSLSITSTGEYCMLQNTMDELSLDSLNPGEFYIDSTDKDILVGSVKNNKIALTSGEKTGNATLTITEGNGGNSQTITRNVYEFSANFPNAQERRIGLNAQKTISFVHKSVGKVTITSDDENVLQLSSNSNGSWAKSITITDEAENEFKILAKNEGTAKITIETETCGSPIESEFSVINMSLKIPEVTTYAGSKELITNDIIVENPEGLTCSSSNEAAATCSIYNTTLRIIPGTQVDNDVTITVSSPKNGITSMKVHVLDTNIKITNESGNDIRYICSEVGKGNDSDIAYVSGSNLAGVNLEVNDKLVTATVESTETNGKRRLLISNTYVNGSVDSPYKLGYNTGKTSVKVIEDRGGKSSAVDYYIYSLNLYENGNVLEESIHDESIASEISVGGSKTYEVSSSIAGDISVSVDDDTVLGVSLSASSYNEGINVFNKQGLVVQAKKEGSAVITIKGSLCGEKKYRIKVTNVDFFIEFKTGTNTEAVNTIKESCTISSGTSCTITVPDFSPKDGFIKAGYNKQKDNYTAQLNPNDELVVDINNSGDVYYANSKDVTEPRCFFEDLPETLSIKSTTTVKLVCLDEGSGIVNSNLTSDNFDFSTPNANITVENSVDIGNGYSYDLKINPVKAGPFKFKLKSSIKDKFDNVNDEIISSNIFFYEYDPVLYWGIGNTFLSDECSSEKDESHQFDVIAELVKNSEYKNIADDETYSLILYGYGETNNYMTCNNPILPLWNMTLDINEDKRISLADYITDAIIDGGITSIGDYMFYNLRELKNVSLPNSLKVIGDNSFTNHKITEIKIPSTVETIGLESFKRDSFSETLKVNLSFQENSNLKVIDEAAFGYLEISDIHIPASVETIENNAFNRNNLNDVNLVFDENSRLKKIGDYAFNNCLVDNLTLPTSLENLGDYALNVKNTEEIVIGKDLKHFGIAAITGKGLKRFQVSNENSSFVMDDGILYSKDMTELVKCPDDYTVDHAELNVPSSVTTLCPGSFVAVLQYGNDIVGAKINLTENVKELSLYDNFHGLTYSQINLNNEFYTSDNGVLYNNDKTTIYLLPTAYDSEIYEILNTVTTISANFGYMNFRVKTLTIPESVKNIGERAFKTDSNYGFSVINVLLTDDSIDVFYDAFDLINFDGSSSADRFIYVKTDEMKQFVTGYVASNPSIKVKFFPEAGETS